MGIAFAWRYSRRMCNNDNADDISNDEQVPDMEDETDDDISQLSELIDESGYSAGKNMKPYVIYPEEFGAISDHETISLTYYADGTLTDDDNVKIDDIEGTVGLDSLTHFHEYEDDSVFVRNERLKCDYEILFDMREYSKAMT